MKVAMVILGESESGRMSEKNGCGFVCLGRGKRKESVEKIEAITA